MKKTLKQAAAIAALCMIPIALHAQIQTDPIATLKNLPIITPKAFCYNDNIFMQDFIDSDGDGTPDDGTIDIYNNNFEKTKTLIINDELGFELHFCDYDTNALECEFEFILTQTLFNMDEKFEYIIPIKEDSKCVGFRIMSEEGSEIQSIRFSSNPIRQYCDDDIYIMKINGALFLQIETYDRDEEYNYTSSYFIYKINQQGLSVKPMAEIPAIPTGHYSMDGRRLSKPQRGINITRNSDGTVCKVLQR